MPPIAFFRLRPRAAEDGATVGFCLSEQGLDDGLTAASAIVLNSFDLSAVVSISFG